MSAFPGHNTCSLRSTLAAPSLALGRSHRSATLIGLLVAQAGEWQAPTIDWHAIAAPS